MRGGWPTRPIRGWAVKLKKTVVLVGMMGSGKTAVGKALAARLGVDFLDSDAEIEAAANMTIAEIFERDGEPFFRRKETQVIDRLLDSHRGILSTGGGAFLAEANRRMISERGVSVWLNADLDLLWTRVRHKDTRPLLRTANPRATLAEIYDRRVPIYALADLTVVAHPDYSVDDMAGKVIETLRTRPDVLE
jgi:shikimate kinase